jgi:hypothetical protein
MPSALTGFKIVCYLALACELAAFGSLTALHSLGVCPTINEGGIECTAPAYESIASFGVMVVLMTVFTGVPGLLAIAGIVFLILWLVRRWRRIAA